MPVTVSNFLYVIDTLTATQVNTAVYDSGTPSATSKLIVLVTSSGGTAAQGEISGVTYNGVAMTSRNTPVGVAGNNNSPRNWLFDLDNPASGSNDIVVTYVPATPSPADLLVSAMVLEGADAIGNLDQNPVNNVALASTSVTIQTAGNAIFTLCTNERNAETLSVDGTSDSLTVRENRSAQGFAAILCENLNAPLGAFSSVITTTAVARRRHILSFEYPASSSASPVTVTSVTPSTFQNGDTNILIAGTAFGATQGTGRVVISPGAIDDASAVEQTATSWGDTEISFTAVRGSLGFNANLNLYVENDSDESNTVGFTVQFSPIVTITDTLIGVTNDPVVSETDILASIWTSGLPDDLPDQTLAGLTTDASGVITFGIDNTGLNDGDPVWLALYKDDALITNVQATLVKIVPTYS